MTTKTTTTMTAEQARALLQGITPGPWVMGTVVGNGNDSPEAVFDVAAETAGVGEVWTSADARLIAAAPDLAASVIALEAERDRCLDGVNRLLAAQREDSARLVAERDAALREAVSRHDDAHRARQERDEARAEVERLRRDCEVTADELAEERTRNISLEGQMERMRAIIEGRTTPPTDEEMDAHDAVGGRWRCVVPDALVMCADALHRQAARMHRDALIAAGIKSMWWALDGFTSKPRKWPVMGGVR